MWKVCLTDDDDHDEGDDEKDEDDDDEKDEEEDFRNITKTDHGELFSNTEMAFF